MTIKFLCLLPLLLMAVRAEEQPLPQVNTELVTLALFEPVTDLFMFDGEKVQPFRSVPRGIGIPMPYRGPAELILQRSPDAFLPEAPPTPPVARIPLPVKADRILILTGKTGNPRLQCKAIPLDTSRVEAGDYLVFNFTRRILALKIGDQDVKLEPGSTHLLSNPAWKQGILDLPVYMSYYSGDEIKTYSSIWGHRPVRRNFLFIVDSESPDDPPKIRRTYDVLPIKVMKPEE